MVPRLSPRGFEKVPCPAPAWQLIESTYRALLPSMAPESFAGKEAIIVGEGNTSNIMTLDQVPGMRLQLLDLLHPLHEAFAGRPITPHCVYGIRSYNRGATLAAHVDRVETHHISSIIIVDHDGAPDWPLQIQAHDGQWHEVCAQPGEMILYESAVCEHARLQPLQGAWFRNLFVHYSLV